MTTPLSVVKEIDSSKINLNSNSAKYLIGVSVEDEFQPDPTKPAQEIVFD